MMPSLLVLPLLEGPVFDVVAVSPESQLQTSAPKPARQSRRVLAVLVVLAAAAYRPALFLTSNAWDLPSPVKTLTVAAALSILLMTALLALTRSGVRPEIAALAIGGSSMILVNWQRLPGMTGLLLLCLVLVSSKLAHARVPTGVLQVLAVSFVAAFGVVPIFQLAGSVIGNAQPFQLVDLRPPAQGVAMDGVEDVVVVIVDSYPNLSIADRWYGHRPTGAIEKLAAEGFIVEPNAWSRHTFTSISVPGILEVQSVIEPGPSAPWGNRTSLWHILRGDNFVSRTLHSAGYTYTHLESGWAGSTCGPSVDRCVHSPWIDEEVWRLLQPTVVGPMLDSRHPFLTGTSKTAENLAIELDRLTTNGTHDYVFAHLLLPHEPVLVDESCTPLADPVEVHEDVASRRAGLTNQMSCVDRLIGDAVGDVDSDTTVIVTGDHGPGTANMIGRPGAEWTDAAIAERFGVFLAYRLASGCESPSLADPMSAMAAVLSCAVGGDFDPGPPVHMIGDHDPIAVETSRMEAIKAAVAAGALGPDPG